MLLEDDLALVGSGERRISDPIDCNVYGVAAPDGVVLVDTGVGHDTARIVENTRDALGAAPTHALLTHCHSDHSQGAPDLQRRGVEIVAPDATAELVSSGSDVALGLDRARRDGVYPEDYEFEHLEPDRTVSPPTEFRAAGRAFRVIRVRGHAVDHHCYLTELNGKTVCFAADAVMADGSIALLNMDGSSLADYRADIDKLQGLGVDALLPGHGITRLNDGQECIDQAAESLAGLASPPTKT